MTPPREGPLRLDGKGLFVRCNRSRVGGAHVRGRGHCQRAVLDEIMEGACAQT